MSTPAGKPRIPIVTDWVILPLAALLFHVLLFTLFVPTEPEDEIRTARSRFTLMLQEDPLRQGEEDDPYKLRYSLLYMNPEDLVKADSTNGFSRILDRKRLTLPSPFRCPHGLYEQKSLFSSRRKQQMPEERHLNDFLFAAPGTQNIRENKAVPGRIRELHYPVWIDHSHKVSTGLFLKDAASLRVFNTHKDRAHTATFLRLDVEKGKIPSVVIRQSCGVPELDQLALRQLSARKENYDFSAGTGKRSTFYQVIWRRDQQIPAERTKAK